MSETFRYAVETSTKLKDEVVLEQADFIINKVRWLFVLCLCSVVCLCCKSDYDYFALLMLIAEITNRIIIYAPKTVYLSTID